MEHELRKKQQQQKQILYIIKSSVFEGEGCLWSVVNTALRPGPAV